MVLVLFISYIILITILIFLLFLSFIFIYIVAAILVHISVEKRNFKTYISALILYCLDLLYFSYGKTNLIIECVFDNVEILWVPELIYDAQSITEIVVFILLLYHYKKFRTPQMLLQSITPNPVY